MDKCIKFYYVPNNPINDDARRSLSLLVGLDIRETICPPSTVDFYHMPFIVEESGERHFGIEGIKRFVSKRLNGEKNG